jgi:hypothetical protein
LPCNEFTPCPCGCACFGVPVYLCLPGSYKDAVKIVGENLNLICKDDIECKNNGSGNLCVRSLESDLEYGVCANSISDAENLIFKIFSKSNSTKDFLEVSVELVTIQLQEREIDCKNERIRFSFEGNQSVTLYIYNSKYQLSHY